MEFYKLDLLHYYTTLGLAWDAALHMSRVDLHLIIDENMYNFVENSIRGSISMISTRHAQANNPSFPDTCYSNLPNQNLIYLDANNLYRWAMPQFLPTHGFRFLIQDEITALSWKTYLMMTKTAIYMKLICIIPLNYTTIMMTIPLLQNHLLLTAPCILQHNSLYFLNLHHKRNLHLIYMIKLSMLFTATTQNYISSLDL